MLVEPWEGATAVLSNRLIALRLLRLLPSRISSEVWWGQRSTSVCGIGNDSNGGIGWIKQLSKYQLVEQIFLPISTRGVQEQIKWM